MLSKTWVDVKINQVGSELYLKAMSYQILANATAKILMDIIEQGKIPSQVTQLAKLIDDISLRNQVVTIFGNVGSPAAPNISQLN